MNEDCCFFYWGLWDSSLQVIKGYHYSIPDAHYMMGQLTLGFYKNICQKGDLLLELDAYARKHSV